MCHKSLDINIWQKADCEDFTPQLFEHLWKNTFENALN